MRWSRVWKSKLSAKSGGTAGVQMAMKGSDRSNLIMLGQFITFLNCES